MTDIILVKRPNVTLVYGNSDVGSRWLRANITHPELGKVVIIQNEFIEDFIKELKLDDLEIEEK